MPIPIPDALDDHAALAVAKAKAARDLPRYLFSAAARRRLRRHRRRAARVACRRRWWPPARPAAKLVQAGVFGVALTLVVFAGAELFTGTPW